MKAMYSGQQRQQSSSSRLGATFSPGYDDFTMPEVVSPAPQRSAPEEFHEIQGKLQHMELGADTIRPTSVQSSAFSTTDTLVSSNAGRGSAMSNSTYGRGGGGGYSDSRGSYADAPSFSPFPKLSPRPPNVPPSDEEKLHILEAAKPKVIASNDPEIQLTWAQDTLNFVEIAAQDETRTSGDSPRPATPRLEHELKQEAINIIGFLSEQYHPRGQFIKGMWLEFGKFGMRKDLRESYRCYARAADRGYARAEYRMGMQFEGSNDIQKAIQHYNIGVQANDAASCYRMGMMTLLGQHGQALNPERGLELIKYSADNADENAPQGAYIYGMLLARDLPQITVPEYSLRHDQEMARNYIEKAAFLGFAKAQVKLGKAYEHGELGCSFDAVLSLHYNNLAARQGDEDAEMAISKWFLSGQEGIFAKNEQMAYLYAQRAARSGLATAEFAMGYFHEVGISVPVDLKEAQGWYKKAAEHGNKDAAGRVEGISRSKTLSRRDHEKIAMAKVRDARADDQTAQPARLADGAPIAMPGAYPPAGNGYPQNGAGIPPAGTYPNQYGQQGPPGGRGYPPQGQYGAAQGGRPSPGPGPGGYNSPNLGPGPGPGPGPRSPYGQQQRAVSSPMIGQGPPNRRPIGQTPPGDIGFTAPPDNYKPRPDYSGSNYRPTPTTRPDYPSQPGTPVGGLPAPQRVASSNVNRPPTNQGRPSQSQTPQQGPPRQQQQQPPQQRPTPQPQAQQQRPPAKQMQQGPSTFDEMGVPKAKDKDDCILM